MKPKYKTRVTYLPREQLKIELIDISRRRLYKVKTNPNNVKEVAKAILYLEKWGVNPKEIAKEILRAMEGRGTDWFYYPLGSKSN